MSRYTNSTWSQWIKKQISEGYSWEDVKNLCVSPDQSEAVFMQLRKEQGLIPQRIQFSEWPSYVEQQRRANRADTLIAVFDRNPENRARLGEWFLRYSMQRSTDLERIWFYEDALDKIERYAMGFHIAFISLDDLEGAAIGHKLYDCNPDCIICYYADTRRDIGPLLHSRPYEFFLWSEGETGFTDRLDDMLCQVVNSKNVFCYETKKMLYCYPVKNLLYFQSDLKFVHIKTVLGNDTDVCAKLTDLEEILDQQRLLDQFIRVHKSFLVNKQFIQRASKNNHTLNLTTGDQVPVSDAYYKAVIKTLSRREVFLPV